MWLLGAEQQVVVDRLLRCGWPRGWHLRSGRVRYDWFVADGDVDVLFSAFRS